MRVKITSPVELRLDSAKLRKPVAARFRPPSGMSALHFAVAQPRIPTVARAAAPQAALLPRAGAAAAVPAAREPGSAGARLTVPELLLRFRRLRSAPISAAL